MSILTRQQILEADDRSQVIVKVPEWGGEVIISAMSGKMRDAWEQSLSKSDFSLENMRARFLAAVAIDEKGDPLFTMKDVEALGKKSGAALNRCTVAAQKLNGMTNDDLEDITKN
jgi:hypothetical protein